MRTCTVHGDVNRESVRVHGNTQHELLSCGCTLETNVPDLFLLADLVLYKGTVYRVESVEQHDAWNQQLHIRNINEERSVTSAEVMRLGPDTVSGLVIKDMPEDLFLDDFVRHRETAKVGRVIRLHGANVRVSLVSENFFSETIWHVANLQKLSDLEVSEMCKCFVRPHASTCPAYVPSRWRTSSDSTVVNDSSVTTTTSSFSRKTSTPSAPSKTVARPRMGVSMAELIKEEVRTLEKQADRPTASDEPSSTPTLPKRRGEDW